MTEAAAIRRFLAIHVVVTAVTVAVSVAAFLSAPVGGFPWLGGAAVLATGAGSLVAVAWERERPIEPDDLAGYRRSWLAKTAWALLPVAVGVAVAWWTGPGWPALLGAVPGLYGLWWARPSDDDWERHQLLYLG